MWLIADLQYTTTSLITVSSRVLASAVWVVCRLALAMVKVEVATQLPQHMGHMVGPITIVQVRTASDSVVQKSPVWYEQMIDAGHCSIDWIVSLCRCHVNSSCTHNHVGQSEIHRLQASVCSMCMFSNVACATP